MTMTGKIGRYEVQSLSGIGGMAAVYKAFDAQLKRLVAIKEISSELLRDPRYVRRFEEEARLLAQIIDPRVVTVFDFFQEGGKYYMVMEYVEGEPLSTYVKEPGLTPPEIHAILVEIAQGLRAVHRIGVVHRDIKPKNVLLTPDRKIKIADFGIAKLMEKEPTIPEGTAKYLAPEVLEGTQIDGRTDIYSLGILAYELFLGDARFNALFPEVYGTAGDLDLKWKSWHLDRQKRLKPLNEYGVQVSPWLAAVLSKAIEKDIDARYQTIDAFLKDLEAAREGGGGTRRFPPGASPTPGAKAGGAAAGAAASRRWLPAVAAAALALAAGLVVATLAFRTSPDGSDDPRPPADPLAAAERFVREGKYDEALRELEILIKQRPNDPALGRRAEEIARLKQQREAALRAADYQKWLQLARRREAERKLAEAEAAYAEALKLAPPGDAWNAVSSALLAVRARMQTGAPPLLAPTDDRSGVVVLESQPPGAQIFVDGRPIGQVTPAQPSLSPGPRRIRLELRLHEAAEFEVTVAAGESVRWPPVALAPARGGIHVTTDPPGARVFLDYDWADKPSPVKIDRVSEGQHFVWAEKDDVGAEQPVFVTRDQTTSVDLKLAPRRRPPRVADRERERESQDLLDEAQAHIGRKEWGEAKKCLQKVNDLRGKADPEVQTRIAQLDVRIALDEARIKEAAGDFAAALTAVESVLQDATDAPELRRAAARLRYKQDSLVRVPAGEFPLGSDGANAEPDEKPVQKVFVDEFLIEKTEVTNSRYAEFLAEIRRTRDHGRCHPDEPKEKDHAPAGWDTDAYRAFSPTPDHPVVSIDWFDAYAYAAWADMRLPTEAEWEKAAGYDDLTGEKRTYPWGNDWDPARANAEGTADGYERLAPVGKFPSGAGPCGAFDMAGNAWEWCADWYADYPPAGTDPARGFTGPKTGTHRAVRGGCWIDNKTSLRVSNRLASLPADRGEGKVGFRCAQDVRK